MTDLEAFVVEILDRSAQNMTRATWECQHNPLQADSTLTSCRGMGRRGVMIKCIKCARTNFIPYVSEFIFRTCICHIGNGNLVASNGCPVHDGGRTSMPEDETS